MLFTAPEARKAPIKIAEVLAVVDPAARHAMPWLRGPLSIRALTVREILDLTRAHPGIVGWVERKTAGSPIEQLEAIGRDAVVAVLSLSTGRSRWRFRKLTAPVLMHGLIFVSEVTFGFRPVPDFFVDGRRPSDDPGLEEGEVFRRDAADTQLMAMARDAAEYQVRTGSSALDLSPAALAFNIYTLGEIDRRHRYNAYLAGAAVQDPAVAKTLMEV